MTVLIMIDAHPLVTGYVSMNIRYLVLVFTLLAVEANADSSTLDAAIGGGIGGAAGAAIGNEVGGRDGAIVGGALGGAVRGSMPQLGDEFKKGACIDIVTAGAFFVQNEEGIR